ncbi:retrovirus-related pol polyprotein from transposon TNT 1-94 [Tanacetum coccineum]
MKCLHLLHMDLFGPVSPMSINHEKYTLVIIDENSRTDNGTKFRNSELERFCDEKGISQNFSSPYTSEQNGVAERKNKTLTEAARTIQYQANYDISYYITPHGRLLTKLTLDNHIPKVITPNNQNIPHIEDAEGHPDLINTKGTQEQKVQNEQINSQPTEETSGNNTKTLVLITKPSVPEVPQSQIIHHASTSSHPVPQDRWSRDQLFKLINIIGELTKGMLTRSMATKLTAASASECLYVDFLYKIEPKKVFEALKHPGWVDTMQEELNQFYRNKVWTLIPLPYGKIAIGSKWVFRNKMDELGTIVRNKGRLVA